MRHPSYLTLAYEGNYVCRVPTGGQIFTYQSKTWHVFVKDEYECVNEIEGPFVFLD